MLKQQISDAEGVTTLSTILKVNLSYAKKTFVLIFRFFVLLLQILYEFIWKFAEKYVIIWKIVYELKYYLKVSYIYLSLKKNNVAVIHYKGHRSTNIFMKINWNE